MSKDYIALIESEIRNYEKAMETYAPGAEPGLDVVMAKEEIANLLLDALGRTVVISEEEAFHRACKKDKRVRVTHLKPIQSGFVYLMRNGSGAVKIGFSQCPKYRERTLQSEEPSVVLLCSFPGSKEDEAQLHERFNSKRLRGEWFSLSSQDIADIKNRPYVR